MNALLTRILAVVDIRLDTLSAVGTFNAYGYEAVRMLAEYDRLAQRRNPFATEQDIWGNWDNMIRSDNTVNQYYCRGTSIFNADSLTYVAMRKFFQYLAKVLH